MEKWEVYDLLTWTVASGDDPTCHWRIATAIVDSMIELVEGEM